MGDLRRGVCVGEMLCCAAWQSPVWLMVSTESQDVIDCMSNHGDAPCLFNIARTRECVNIAHLCPDIGCRRASSSTSWASDTTNKQIYYHKHGYSRTVHSDRQLQDNI